jgi:hypothetical protein
MNHVTVPTDATLLDAYTKKNIKAKRIILDSIKDHVIPHVTGKSNSYEMWESLTKLYQSSNENRKMVLREKLKGIKMTKIENVVTYLTKITQVRDELGVIGEVIANNELVRTALNGVTKQWDVFVEGIVARENMPKWDHLWDDFIQEETQRGYVQGTSSNGNDEENVTLATKRKGKKKDMSKVKCFACQKFGHYAGQCPNKKKVKKEAEVVASAATDEFVEQFEKEFSLVSCLSSSSVAECEDTGAWFVDSGASHHMTRTRVMFLSITDIDSDMHVDSGVNTTHAVEGVGWVRFQLESGGYLEVARVLLVPELRTNLLSVSALEDDGYAVLFCNGRVVIYLLGESPDATQVLGIRDGRMYRLLGQPVDRESNWISGSVVVP